MVVAFATYGSSGQDETSNWVLTVTRRQPSTLTPFPYLCPFNPFGRCRQSILRTHRTAKLGDMCYERPLAERLLS